LLDSTRFISFPSPSFGFLGPALGRWLNRDVHFRSSAAQPGPWSGFLLGFAFGWTPCIGPILTTVLAFAAANDKIGRGVLLLAAYSAGLAVPFVVTALGISRIFGRDTVSRQNDYYRKYAGSCKHVLHYCICLQVEITFNEDSFHCLSSSFIRL